MLVGVVPPSLIRTDHRSRPSSRRRVSCGRRAGNEELAAGQCRGLPARSRWGRCPVPAGNRQRTTFGDLGLLSHRALADRGRGHAARRDRQRGWRSVCGADRGGIFASGGGLVVSVTSAGQLDPAMTLP